MVLNAILDENHHYSANTELVRWETNIRKRIEEKKIQDRGKSDCDRYLEEELKYNGTMPWPSIT